METLTIKTDSQTQLKDVTSEVQKAVAASGVKEGVCTVYVPHTTAGVTINENADPSVRQDILMEVNKVVPMRDNYSHAEGNSAAHIKSSLFGCSCDAPIENGGLSLGTWQGIFLAEFDGPRTRKLRVICK